MAVNIGPRIGVDGEREYRKQVNNLITQAKTFSAEMRELESSFDKNTSAMEKTRKKSDLLKNQIKNQEKIVEELEKGLAACAEKYGDNATETKKWQQQVSNAKTELNDLNRQLQNLPSSLQVAGQKMQTVGQGMQSVGGTLSKYVTAPLVGLGVASVKMASDAESSFAKVRTIIDSSVVSYEQLTAGVKAASDETGVAITDFNEALYSSVSAGVDSGNAIAFTTDMVKLAKGGFTDTSKAVDVVTTVLNAYGMSADEASSISDKLITTQNLGKTTVDELAGALGRVIPTAKAANVDFDQLSTGMAILTKRGISTNEATTYLNAMLAELSKSGSTVDKTLREKTGKSFKELQEAGVPLNEVLQILDQAAQDDNKSLSDLFSQQNAGKAALTILSDGGAEFAEILGQMANSAGATEEAFQTIANTSEEKFQIALNRLKNSGIELGNSLLDVANPAIEDLADGLKKATSWYGSLDDKQKQMIAKAGAVVAAVGPVVSILGRLTSGVGAVVEGLAKIPGASAFLTEMGGPVALAAGAFTLLSAGVKNAREEAIDSVDGLREMLEGTASSTDALNNSVDILKNTINTTNETVKEIDGKAALAKNLTRELYKLDSQSKKTAEQQARMKSIVEQLNAIYPDLKLSIDDTTGALSKSREEVDDYIDSARNMALINAYSESIQKSYSDLVNAQMALKKAQDEQSNALDVYSRAYHAWYEEAQKHIIGYDQLGNAIYDNSVQLIRLHDATELAHGALEQQNETVKNAKQEVANCEKSISDMTAEQDKLTGKTKSATKAEKDQTKETGNLADGADDAAEAVGDFGDEIEETGEQTKDFGDKIVELEKAIVRRFIVSVKDAFKSASDASEAVKDDWNASVQKVSESVQKSIGLFDKMEEKDKVSIETLKANATARRQAIENYADNLSKLMQWAEEDGSQAAKDYVAAIAEMGIGAAAEVETLANSANEDLRFLADENYEATVTAEFIGEQATKASNDFRTKEELAFAATSSNIGKSLRDALSNNSIFQTFTANVKAALDGAQTEASKPITAKIGDITGGVAAGQKAAKEIGDNAKANGTITGQTGAKDWGLKAAEIFGANTKANGTITGQTGGVEAGKKAAKEIGDNAKADGTITGVNNAAAEGKKAGTVIGNNAKATTTISVTNAAQAGKNVKGTIGNNAKATTTISISNASSAGTKAKNQIKSAIGTIYVPVAAKGSAQVRVYAEGGLVDKPTLSVTGEAGPEMIIPLSATRRARALDLYQQTGEMLGVNSVNSPTVSLPSNDTSDGGRTMTPKDFNIDLSELFDTVASAARAGMQSADLRIYWNDREAGRIMRDMGVQFA